ncbi:ABC transporter ATP-binding protein [Rhodoferax sp.]|uniref:ABC transporter ATP-binding protein n=1 Tax=Rhodoferax sp. TaxID=50421 RepID=UPI00374D8632
MNAIELKDLRKSFGATEIVRGAHLAVAPGQRVAIIGPNGAGKSTLFNLISGRHAPSSGEILLRGQTIQGMRPFQINRLGLSRSFQVSHLFPQLSVFENLRCSVLWSLGYGYTFWKFLAGLHDANALADQALAQVRLQHKRDVLAGQLGYAEQRALELGITIASGAHTVLLDEPTAGMGAAETQAFVQLIREVTQDKTLLIVEHDMQVVYALADKIAVMVAGQVIAFDTPEAIRANPQVQSAYLGAVA